MYIHFPSLFRSMAQMISFQFKKKSVDVLFYYPAHFNRDKDGQNPFFKPFFAFCHANNLTFIVFEEPDLSKRNKRNKKAIPFDVFLISILSLRKLLPLSKFDNFEKREQEIGRIIKKIFFRNLHFQNCIVMSNSLLGFFRGMEPEASLYDYQHGVITSTHKGYFGTKKTPASHIIYNDVHILVYGKKFKDILEKNDNSGYYKSHTHVVGKNGSEKRQSLRNIKKRNILFTLQITGKGEYPELQSKWLDSIIKFFEAYESFFLQQEIHFFLKPHPRYDGSISIDVLGKFPFATITDRTFNELCSSSFLHMTLFSTSIFDAAALGLPTLLWQTPDKRAFIYTDEFDYPLGTFKTEGIIQFLQKLFKDENLYRSICRETREWYMSNFSTFQESTLLYLLSKKGHLYEKN